MAFKVLRPQPPGRHLIAMRLQGAVSLLRGALRAAGSSTQPKFSNAAAASLVISRGFAEDAGELKKTPLYDFHVEHGGEHCLGTWSVLAWVPPACKLSSKLLVNSSEKQKDNSPSKPRESIKSGDHQLPGQLLGAAVFMCACNLCGRPTF